MSRSPRAGTVIFVSVQEVEQLRAAVMSKRVTMAVRAAMTSRGWNRTQLAVALGVSQSWVSNKLNGHRGWVLEDLALLETCFGMPAAAFLVPQFGERARRDSNPQPSYPKFAPPTVNRVTLAPNRRFALVA